MNIKTFYRMALILPIILPLLALLFVGVTSISALLLMSLYFSGIEYLIFATIMFYLIGKYQTTQKIRRLFWLTPPIFVLLSIFGWHVRLYINTIFNPVLIFSFDMILPLLFYGLLVGYGYCLFIELIYQVFKSRGWVRVEQQNR